MNQLFLFLFFTLQSQSEPLQVYRLDSREAQTIASLSRFFEIQKPTSTDFHIVVPKGQLGLFESIAPRAQLIDEDMDASSAKTLQSFSLLASEAKYRTFDEVQKTMQRIVDSLPGQARLIRYGTSAQGRALLALHIGKDIEQGDEARAVMITAATHGDELVTTEVTLRLLERFLSQKSTNPRLEKIFQSIDIYWVPVVNPDGFVNTARYDGSRDPNRSYPYPENPNQTPTASIKGIMDFFQTHNIVGSLDFHAFGEMVMYPWAYTHEAVEESARLRFHALTQQMAEQNRYAYGPISEVIYVAPGSSADYYFWRRGTVSIAIEVGQSKIPNPRQLEAYTDAQTEALWRFLESF